MTTTVVTPRARFVLMQIGASTAQANVVRALVILALLDIDVKNIVRSPPSPRRRNHGLRRLLLFLTRA